MSNGINRFVHFLFPSQILSMNLKFFITFTGTLGIANPHNQMNYPQFGRQNSIEFSLNFAQKVLVILRESDR